MNFNLDLHRNAHYFSDSGGPLVQRNGDHVRVFHKFSALFPLFIFSLTHNFFTDRNHRHRLVDLALSMWQHQCSLGLQQGFCIYRMDRCKHELTSECMSITSGCGTKRGLRTEECHSKTTTFTWPTDCYEIPSTNFSFHFTEVLTALYAQAISC